MLIMFPFKRLKRQTLARTMRLFTLAAPRHRAARAERVTAKTSALTPGTNSDTLHARSVTSRLSP